MLDLLDRAAGALISEPDLSAALSLKSDVVFRAGDRVGLREDFGMLHAGATGIVTEAITGATINGTYYALPGMMCSVQWADFTIYPAPAAILQLLERNAGI